MDEIIKKEFPDCEEYNQYLYDFSSNTIDIYTWYADTYLKSQIQNSIKISLIKNEMDEIIKKNLVRILKNHDSTTQIATLVRPFSAERSYQELEDWTTPKVVVSEDMIAL